MRARLSRGAFAGLQEGKSRKLTAAYRSQMIGNERRSKQLSSALFGGEKQPRNSMSALKSLPLTFTPLAKLQHYPKNRSGHG